MNETATRGASREDGTPRRRTARLGVAFDTLVAFLQLVTKVFFRTIEVVGLENVPEEGPVIFTGNHPNSLLDPVLITTTCGRRVRFAAKDVLFENRVLRFFLDTLGAVPIKRRQDHTPGHVGEDAPVDPQAELANVDNTAAFDALFAVLEEGGAFGIFPEGISHTRSELAPLKTGAARIALGSARAGTGVVIVPCGLTYKRRTRLRSRVLVQFGQPIEITEELLARFAEDPKAAAYEVTEQIKLGLRALTINAPDFDTLKVLDGVRRLYSPAARRLSLAERAEITRRFIDHYERYQDHPEVHALYSDVEAYQFKLSALGVRDRDLTRPLSVKVWAAKILAHLFLVLVLVPLALPGLIIHAPILVAAVFAGEALTSRKDVVATTKLMTATGLVVATYAAIVGLLVYVLTFPVGLYIAPAVVATLLLSGWAMIKVLERQSVIRKGVTVMVLLVDLRAELARLRGFRDELRQRTLDLVDRLIDPEVERIISRDEQSG